MPSRHLWWFVEQMPILQARESIMRINEAAYASGSFSKEDGATYFNELRANATPADQPMVTAERPKSLELLASMVGNKTSVHVEDDRSSPESS